MTLWTSPYRPPVSSLTRFNEAVESGVTTSTTIVSAAFTPENNSLLVVILAGGASGSSDPEPDLVLNNSAGLTFTKRIYQWRQNDAFPTYGTWAAIYTAPVTTAVSMTVTGETDGIQQAMFMSILSYTGYDTGSPTGATAATTRYGAEGSISATLTANPASDSEVITGAIATSLGAAVAGIIQVGTGWSAIHSNEGESEQSYESAARTGSTSTTVLWDQLDCISEGENLPGVVVALEIKAASSGSSNTTNQIKIGGTVNDGNQVRWLHN